MSQPNYKIGTRTLIFSMVLAIIVIFALFGCGSRKVERSKAETKETATFKDSSKTVTKLESNTKIVDVSQSDEIEIVPIDVNKPFFVNNVEYKNAVLKSKKVRNNITTDKSINTSQIEQNDVKKAVAKTDVVDVKNTERENSYWWLLWFLLLIPIYFGYRKFKGLPLV